MSEALIKLLADGRFYSGQALGAQLGVSRSAIWKYIRALSKYQLEVHAVTGKGYRLSTPLELLDKNTMLRELSSLWPDRELPEIDVLFDVDSTNRYLIDKSKFINNSKVSCFAEYQYAGRGRRGRAWASPFGSNLYCSILWRPNLSLNALSCLGLVVGIALIRTLSAAGLSGQKIKWPNDIVWQGRKLAGILIEAAGEVTGPAVIVIGIGLNVNMPNTAGDTIDQPWIDLSSALEHRCSRNTVAALLLKETYEVLTQFELGGFESFHEEWKRYDLLNDKSVMLQLGNEVIMGSAVGVDNQGALLVRSKAGDVKRYFSGEVSVRYDV